MEYTKEQLWRMKHHAPELYEALEEISEGKGRYSMDKLTHASNTIEDMKALAIEALAKAKPTTQAQTGN